MKEHIKEMEKTIEKKQEIIDKLINTIYELTKNTRDYREEEKHSIFNEIKNYYSSLHNLRDNNTISEELHDTLIHKFAPMAQKIMIMLDIHE